MLEIKNLSIEKDQRFIIKDLSITVNKGDKLAVIGEEGNGKSSLLKAIVGICDYANVTGIINTNGNRVSYLSQTIEKKYLDLKVYDYIFQNDEDYYEKIGDFYKLIESVEIQSDILEQTLKNLSGGEKVKVSLIKILLENADILLLDEPTNDLDIETLEWLERFINRCNLPIIYVSHDETLLANTANRILHLEQLNDKSEFQYTIASIGYDEYVESRNQRIAKQIQVANQERRDFIKKETKLKQVINKVEFEQRNISRGDPHGARLLKKKMHSLKSQERRLENAELAEVPDYEESINLAFKTNSLPNSKVVLNLELDELKIENKILSKNIKLSVIGNEHICITGKNGVGKSTLIKIIYETLKNKNDFKVGYMPQVYDDILGNYEYVLDFIAEKNKESITKARTMLGSVNFTKDEMTGKISDLSNGSKAKLLLVHLVLSECNVLILDEPTRNTSPLSNPVIRKILREFDGAIISISHDRKYIDEVSDKIYILNDQGLWLD